jgi:hypothetical protein
MKDYTGLKNNMLEAIKFIKRENNRTFWLFKCDCGNEKIIKTDRVFLKNTTTISCGCYKKNIWLSVINNNKNKKFNPSLIATQKELYRKYKCNAKKRSYSFNISFEYFISLTNKNCFYCGSIPKRVQKFQLNIKNKHIDYICNGVDRVNNLIGYIEGNCVPCCTICNRAKNNLKLSDFLNWIKNIKEFNI